ncbi:MAG: DUF3375 domain-containing protein [Treponema sp.]|nr:DUF3375 domain-containing protein [Treponema sp.]
MELTTSSFQTILASDIGVSLLRSRSASVVIPFLFENFKLKIRQQIDSSELEDRLVDYIQNHINAENELEEELDSTENAILQTLDNKKRAKKYIDSWCSPQRRYLRRIINNNGSVLLLDPAVDRMFSWLEKCQETETVGAESRFNNILFQLRDLNQKTNQNAAARIEELKKQKDELDKEIQEIERTGKVNNTYDKFQIQERLSVITQSSKDLLGDFNQIRTNFQNVINDIYNQQSQKQSSRGDILGYTLDTNDELRKSPQGRSFTSFWNFISADTENEINNLVDSIMEKAAEKGLNWNDRFLYNLSQYFFDSGNQIIAQNRILTSRINKMLSFKESGTTTKIHELTNDIKENMLLYNKLVKDKVIEPSFFEIEIQTKPNLSFPQARIPVLPEFDLSFGTIESFDNSTLNQEAIESLALQFRIDTELIEKNLKVYYKELNRPFTLGEFIKKNPIKQGLSEIVAFFTIKENIKSTIDDSQYEEIIYSNNGRNFAVKIPRIIFYE